MLIWGSTLFHELGHSIALYIVNINNPKPFPPIKISVWGAYGITNSKLFHWIRRTPAKVRIVAISGYLLEFVFLIFIITVSLLIKKYYVFIALSLYNIFHYFEFRKSKDFRYFKNPSE